MPITPEQLADLTPEQTRELLTALSTHLAQLEQANAEETETRRGDITGAVTALEGLLGPANPDRPSMERLQAGDVSIREVNTFTAEELGAHAGLALKLILSGMDVLTGTTLDVARVIGT